MISVTASMKQMMLAARLKATNGFIIDNFHQVSESGMLGFREADSSSLRTRRDSREG